MTRCIKVSPPFKDTYIRGCSLSYRCPERNTGEIPDNIIVYEFSGLQSGCCSNDNLLGYHTMQVDTGVSDECTTSILIISNLNTNEVSA
jgi:hypothetical protein